MLNDKRIRIIHDFFNSTECFAGVDISGGCCYFLWDRSYNEKCTFISHLNGKTNEQQRYLAEFGEDKFIRFNKSLSIVKKVNSFKEIKLSEYVSSQNPFNLNTNFRDFQENEFENSVKLFAYPNNGYINRDKITKGQSLIDKWKVFSAKAYGERGDFPYLVLGKPFVGGPNTASTATYRIINSFNTEKEAKNFVGYMKTRFFRFLVLLIKNTQDAPTRVYSFVPIQDFNEEWTDEKLYKKYGLTQEEIDFIESMIRPME